VLGAVEWVVPKEKWDAAGNTTLPVVFGHPLPVLNPVPTGMSNTHGSGRTIPPACSRTGTPMSAARSLAP